MFTLYDESNSPNHGWWCLAFSITSAHSFLLLVSVLSLLYLYVSHITMMFLPPLNTSFMSISVEQLLDNQNQPEGVRVEFDRVEVGIRVGTLSLGNIWLGRYLIAIQAQSRPGNRMTRHSSRWAGRRGSWGTPPRSWSSTSSPLQCHRSRCKELGPWARRYNHYIRSIGNNGTNVVNLVVKVLDLPGALVKLHVLVQYGFVGLGVHLKKRQIENHIF